ncbi:MAG: ABC transporter ATP-binding protein [Desulfobaccales bacterium]
MLRVADLEVSYDEVPALRGLTIAVQAGEIVSVIGSNGAGKTTLLKAISGLLHPLAGTVEFLGEDITALNPYDIVARGMSHVPEGRLIFGKMNVLDNLLLGAYTRRDQGEIEATLASVFTIFPRLRERQFQKSETLSGGEQQMLAIARGLMSRPKLLILDEPSLGLMPKLVDEVFEVILRLRSEGLTVLLIEQNVYEALEVADRAYVLQTGRIVLEGAGEALLSHDGVRKAYLGIS